MTPEELNKRIEENRRQIQEVTAEQLRQRAIHTALLEEATDIPDEELETRRYEPADAAQAREIPDNVAFDEER